MYVFICTTNFLLLQLCTKYYITAAAFNYIKSMYTNVYCTYVYVIKLISCFCDYIRTNHYDAHGDAA